VLHPVIAEAVKKLMSGQHIIEGYWRLSAQSFGIPACPLSGQGKLFLIAFHNGAHDGNSKRVSACAAGYSYDKHSRLLSEQLDTLGREWICAVTAELLLEVFLNGLKTSALELAHFGPSFLGSG
jgi:hypothetical protein